MRLHSGDLFWDETRKEADYQELTGHTDTGVLVVGGGMSGAMIANELVHAGHQVTVVDANVPGLASSDGNTCIVQYCSDMSLHEMIGKWGERHAVDFYRFSLEGMTQLGKIVKRLGVDVGYKPGHSLFLAGKESGIKAVAQQCKTLVKHGFPAEYINAETLKSNYCLVAHGTIRTGQDANLNPYKMVQALHRDSMKQGARVYKNARMTSYKKRDDGYLVRIGMRRIRAKTLILAMGYARDAYPPIEGDVARNTTYSFVTKPVAGKLWGKGDMVWDDQDRYTYFRITEDKRVIAGGRDRSGDKLFGKEKIMRETDTLLHKIHGDYPPLDVTVTHRWQSVFGESNDGLPFIGQDKDDPDLYFAFGFGGNGTCYCAMAPLMMRDFLKGTPHPLSYTTAYPRAKKAKR